MNEAYFVIVEQCAPSPSSETFWTNSMLPRLSLMRCRALSHLAQEGPWLLAAEGDVLAVVNELREQLGDQAIMGRLSSNLPHTSLAAHLSRALVAQNAEGRSVLLRSYSPQVMPVLHARTDCSWRDYLFGPINSWWVNNGTDVQQYSGKGLSVIPDDFQPIILDDHLLAALGSDQQALALLEELERAAPQIFKSDCHGERLSQVDQALILGRNSGLSHSEDQLLFATLTLLEGQPPDRHEYWAQVLQMVSEQPITLGHALEQVLEETFHD